MLISRLHQFFTVPRQEKEKFFVGSWLTLSCFFATIYGLQALQKAFSSEYIVQDDARQFVFWMQQFVDPKLLSDDLMADYYRSITPPGFAILYWLMAKIGVAPLLLSKLLPVILGIVTTVYVFGVTIQIFPVPAAGFLASLLLNQSMWLRNDLASATPKAFAYPLLAAFIYYLLRRALIPCLIAIALESLFFPPVALISGWVLLLGLWRDRKNYVFYIIGLAVAGIFMLPYATESAKFAPLISIAEAKAMPEFMVGARVSFFYNNNPLEFWVSGRETGVFPLVGPAQIFMGILLPILLKYRPTLPLINQIKPGIKVLTEITIASFIMFFAAHLLMFKLYGPSRYTQHSLRIVLAIASAILLILLLDAAFKWTLEKRFLIPLGFSLLIFLALVFYPSFLQYFPRPGYIVGEAPELYRFLQQQPKDSSIASFTLEANNIPTFAQRPILVAREYALPFHGKYYSQIRQRALDLIGAQYSTDLKEVQQFIQKYGVDFWLLDKTAFEPTYFQQMEPANKRWIDLYQPAAKEAMSKIEQGTVPALAKITDRCAAIDNDSLILLQSSCILQTQTSNLKY